jgi:hypothetical protein
MASGTYNASGKWLHLTPDREVTDQYPPPDGSTVLAAPGGLVPSDLVTAHDLADRLDGPHKQPALSATGEPLVHLDNGRAMAVSAVPESMRPKELVEAGLVPRNQSTAEVVRTEMARQRAQAEAADEEEDVEEDDPDKPGHKRTVRRKKGTRGGAHSHAHTKAVRKSDTEDK